MEKPRKYNRPCCFCVTPYRSEIIKLHTQGMPYNILYKKFTPLINYTSSYYAFLSSLKNHIKRKHNVSFLVLPGDITKKATLENFGQKMLELGMTKIEGMSPDQVALKDVISSQKLILDSKKLRITEDAMLLILGKLFAPPFLEFKKPIEGEVINEPGRNEISAT